MRFIRNIVLLALLGIGAFYVFELNTNSPEEAIDSINDVVKEKDSQIETKRAPEKEEDMLLEEDLLQWIGKSQEVLVEALGEPNRTDRSAYEYTWWVYTDSKDKYIQFGMQDNKIITVYAAGNALDTEPIQVGQGYDAVDDQLSFSNELTYSQGLSSYIFLLNQDDLKTRPLVKVSDNIFIQIYFDTFTQELSSIRVLTADTLLKHRPYELEYRGDLPDEPDLTDEQWAEVEEGMEKQIFDITNVMRHQHERPSLNWEDTVSEVAFSHSKDMAENNYFSHYSQNGDGLKERLSVEDIFYATAGENIAAQYPDAPAAMEGWLNSEGHREALLNGDYTHLGVGVYRFYYTQNFLEKP
ncbi:CAP domain-containing protein [Virgibacillus sp. NKC19-16]|uniref:CAP domain-containing protein n=1 Tax=Virgibacillus salidurans TaxID=2831673 RepID=UPI001F17DCA9|nr:CAP domain-containing protein [Virgibacillus sp. NKC19-16]UJL47829.1 CAP domain-containing protein [Virgibacillus sp. NKC19-16]